MTSGTEYCRAVREDPRGENWSDLTRAHAAACPACKAYLDCCQALGERLTGHPFGCEDMPPALRDKLLRECASAPVAGAAPARRGAVLSLSSMRRIMVPLAMAASLVLGVVLEKAYEFGGPGALPAEVEKDIGLYIFDVTHDHYLLERIGRPLEVAISDAVELSSWLSASLNFSFDLPRDTGALSLEGGRVWHTVGRLSALASYRTAGGDRVVMFAVPAENMNLAGAESSLVGDVEVFTGTGWNHEARVWIEGDLAIALTAPEGRMPDDWADVFLP